ncbi:MAG: ATP-binding protein [Peptoniphilus sp.]|uniref:sensor histidine kinase n=1 Tax=Peptoniphilus sp. TaxID=1971214 RepID=UPI002A75B25B|nr:ATP-binding protein [Peptoniphilus sp.]MDY2987367.1 ATP-binding protein [Peptoniphilus sp.]
MDRHIKQNFIIIAAFSFIVTFIVSFVIYFMDYNQNEYQALSDFNYIIQQEIYKETNRELYISELSEKTKGIRIRYSRGLEKYDSKENEDFNLTVGDNKDSVSFTKDEFEVVKKLNDGSLLGVSRIKDNFFGIFLHLLPINLLALGSIFIFTRIITKKSIDKILKPINSYEKSGDIEKIMDVPEVYPLGRILSKQNDLRLKELGEVKRQRDTINTILGGMKEGLLILDEKRRILMLNSEASKILETDEESIAKSILYVTRNSEIVKSIENCYLGMHSEGRFEVQDRYIKYYSNPVYYNGNISGAVLLLIDETKRIEAEKIREEFSANVSHELRTPLTSIYGFAELLNTRIVSDENDKKEMFDRIYKESKRLLDLIDEIIKISNLESNVQVIEDIVDLNELSEDLKTHFIPIATEKNVELAVVGDGVFKTNKTMIWELLANLIENAIKYNVENGSVDVSMKVSEHTEIVVKDSGIGIDEENLKRIFERFYRVDKSRNKKSGGTGLGLSIVKHIVKNLNGEIEVQSEAGVGTTIKIQLPIN